MWTKMIDPVGLKKVFKIPSFFDLAAGRCCFVLPCPVWVKTWVKNVVLLWVSQTGSFHHQIWTYDTFKTTLDSLFRGSR